MNKKKLSEAHWKMKYERLQAKIQEISETANWDQEEEQPDALISASGRFFMSNSMDVCDSEDYAKESWGDRYREIFFGAPQ